MSAHDHVPDPIEIAGIRNNVEPAHAARAYAVYLAVLLIGQRTPEELVVLAEYLQTGDTSTMTR